MENRLNVEYIPVGQLKPYEKNARKHAEYDVGQIAESIKRYGFNDPVGIWGKDNIIVEGHGRLLAAKKLGMKEVPCIRLDDLTDEQRREYAIMHNKTAELSAWDFDLLATEIDGLDFSGFDIDWGLPADEEETEIIEDEVPEVDEEHEPICKLGDIWQLGEHRLMCGDSTDKATVERLMDGKKADLLLTDPPYGIDYGGLLKGKGDGKGGADKNGWKSYDCPTWDKERPSKSLFDLLLLSSKNQIIWGGNYFADILPPKMCWLVWDKGQRDFSLADGELAWTSFDKALRIKTYSRASANKENKVHPTQKPIELLRWCIEDIADRNMENIKTVLDLFGGSGSTLIACEQLNRRCYMLELSPKYCDVILKRYINLKGSSEDVYRLNADGTKTKYSEWI